MRNPPRIAVALPLPCDLAHAISIELEGIAERFSGGFLLVSGQGLPRQHSTKDNTVSRRFELGPVVPLARGLIERPGPRRMRIWLEAALDSGWADPDDSVDLAGTNSDRLGRGGSGAALMAWT